MSRLNEENNGKLIYIFVSMIKMAIFKIPPERVINTNVSMHDYLVY